MDVFNLVAEQDWEDENDREGYRHRVTAVGRKLGARLLGGSLYELPPGEKTWPYHYEIGCEEWVVAVSGRPSLRGPDGERELEPGDVAVCPEGPDGAHQHQPLRRALPGPDPLLQIAARARPLPGQRQGRPLVAGGRLPGHASADARARLLGRRELTLSYRR